MTMAGSISPEMVKMIQNGDDGRSNAILHVKNAPIY
jgi:hypothetical protein